MVRQKVSSSNIASVGFDPTSKTLEIEFIGGGIYQYNGPAAEGHYTALIAAPSKGSYFAQKIRHDKSLTVSKVA